MACSVACLRQLSNLDGITPAPHIDYFWKIAQDDTSAFPFDNEDPYEQYKDAVLCLFALIHFDSLLDIEKHFIKFIHSPEWQKVGGSNFVKAMMEQIVKKLAAGEEIPSELRTQFIETALHCEKMVDESV